MKAQVDVISIVLVVGIVTTLLGSVYMWGGPLMEKRSAFNDYKICEGFIIDLDEKVTQIASGGGGEVNVKIPLGSVKVIPYGENDPNNNSIILEYISKQPPVMGGESYIKTTTLGETAPYGSEPRVISVKSEKVSSGYLITIKLHYRELILPDGSSSVIALQTQSQTGGSDNIQIVYAGDEVGANNKYITRISVNPQ